MDKKRYACSLFSWKRIDGQVNCSHALLIMEADSEHDAHHKAKDAAEYMWPPADGHQGHFVQALSADHPAVTDPRNIKINTYRPREDV